VTIFYLPEEQEDAEETKKMVEKEGRKCRLVALNLKDFEAAKKVGDHVSTFGSLDMIVSNASRQVFCKDVAEIDLSTSPT
jgi:NAD(P)-dependent dehydrogenase (short-subunit alcohol dehydrogenase family)